jgi:hypothetical protein
MSDTPRTDAAILTEPFQVRTLNFEVVTVDFASQLERELAASQAGQAELLARLEERTQSHLHASARDVQTIQQQAVELTKWQAEAARLSAEREHNANMAGMWQALAEGLAGALSAIHRPLGDETADSGNPCTCPTPPQGRAITAALAAYEAAKAGLSQKARLDAGPGLA